MAPALQYIPLILICVLLNTVAQIVLKMGARSFENFDFSVSNLIVFGLKIAENPYILGGIFLYVLSMLFWLITLSRVEVSYAYPFSSLGYVLTAVAGYYLLQENLSLTRILGIVIILIGVYLVSRSA